MSQFTTYKVLFTPKIVTKFSKIWGWDRRSGIRKNLSWIPDPGVKRHRIPDPYPQHLYRRYPFLFYFLFQLRVNIVSFYVLQFSSVQILNLYASRIWPNYFMLRDAGVFFCQQDFNIPSLVICLSISTVFRIHDILGWIRIGSMPLTNGSGSGSCYFVLDLQDVNKKLFFYFSTYYFLKVHLHHFSNIKSPKEVTKQ